MNATRLILIVYKSEMKYEKLLKMPNVYLLYTFLISYSGCYLMLPKLLFNKNFLSAEIMLPLPEQNASLEELWHDTDWNKELVAYQERRKNER